MEWRRLLAEQEASGLSLREFAEAQGLAYSTATKWRQRFARERRAQAKPRRRAKKIAAAGEQGVPLVPVRLAGSPASSSADAVLPFELSFPRGVTVRVPAAFDPGSLEALLRALRTAGC